MDIRERILFDGGPREPVSINWPAGLAPHDVSAPAGGSIPHADVLVVTWTSAEARALADVLTPGVQSTSWVHYTVDFAAYEPQLTGRSPAAEAKRLGEWCLVTIGAWRVLCFHSQLHPATDGPTLPAAQLAAQLAADVAPSLIITTGTAGGAGNGTLLGDVNVAQTVRADFTARLKGKPWSQGSWACVAPSAVQLANLAKLPQLAPSGKLPSAARPPKVWAGDDVSTDFFAFDSTDNAYGLRTVDPSIRSVEMDDAAIGLGAAKGKVPFMSVRNASDPVMPDDSAASKRSAEQTYQRYGYDTTVNSAICVWALIAGYATL